VDWERCRGRPSREVEEGEGGRQRWRASVGAGAKAESGAAEAGPWGSRRPRRGRGEVAVLGRAAGGMVERRPGLGFRV